LADRVLERLNEEFPQHDSSPGADLRNWKHHLPAHGETGTVYGEEPSSGYGPIFGTASRRDLAACWTCMRLPAPKLRQVERTIEEITGTFESPGKHRSPAGRTERSEAIIK